MSGWVQGTIAGFAILFGLGLGLSTGPLAEVFGDAKREDDVREIVTVDDDDPQDVTRTKNTKSRGQDATRAAKDSSAGRDGSGSATGAGGDASDVTTSPSAATRASRDVSADRTRDAVSRDAVSRDAVSRDSGSRD